MIVTFGDNNQVTIVMTADELGTLRYALHEGAEKLDQTAHFLRSAKAESAGSATKTAEDALAVNVLLEDAVQKAIHG